MPFVKGQSGNPGGKVKKDNELKLLCKKATAASFEKIQNLANNADDEGTALRANTWICEYAWGKASQDVEVSGTIEWKPGITFVTPSDSE